jgi:hypothetical protein
MLLFAHHTAEHAIQMNRLLITIAVIVVISIVAISLTRKDKF